MKKILIYLILFSGIIFSQNYEIENIRAVGQIPSTSFSDVWGYTAPDGHEFALAGKIGGTSIIDISTDPHNPTEVGFIPGANSTWRDLKVHDHYCYVTNENTGGVDIISLEDPFNPYLVSSYTSSTLSAHNLFIADGYAYLVGSAGGAGGTSPWQGIIILDLSDPENPNEVSRWEEAYIHDLYVKNDTAYACGISLGSLFMIDVSDKLNPTTMVEHNYSNYGCHAVWVSDDSKYAITADEENAGYIRIFDIQDFNNINLLATWYPNEPQASNKSSHNVFFKDDLLYISYYVYGTRIVDMSDPSNPVEIGFYDFYPGQGGLYNGNWGTYPYTGNGLVYSTDFSGNGFFVMSYPFMGEIIFEKLGYTEDNISDIPLSVTIDESPDHLIDNSTLQLFWGMDGTITDSVVMNADEFQYTANIVPNGEDGVMHYYVAYETTNGDRVTKPYGAPFSTFTFTIASDFIPPEIIQVSHPIGSIQNSGQQRIRTRVRDNYGISNVYLHYSTDGTNWEQTEMSFVGSSDMFERFGGIIEWENLPIPTEISYYIECVDMSQNENITTSEILNFDVGYMEMVDDFESDLYKWDTGLGWGLMPEFGINNSYSIHDSPSGNYGNSQSNHLTLITSYDLSPFSSATLSFSHLYYVHPDQDYCYVEASADSINWNVIATYTGWQENLAFEELNFDNWTGPGFNTVFLRFTMESNSAQTADGWYIDNILWETSPSLEIDDQVGLLSEIVLHRAYPNPFNPITSIRYNLPQAGLVNLKIYDLMGREIRTLTAGFENAGEKSAIWNARDNQGNLVSSGVYIYRLETAGQVQSNKLILLK
ncbi:MAG: choice-of-anchor B family protein [Candidatus Marinimicrobia bacterium]|nr:choice-of-anchor B family protein [Candidatus Neomarinimicrobiota bacterium]